MGKEKESSARFPAKIHARVWLGELVDTDGTEGSTHLIMARNPCSCLASWRGKVGMVKESLWKYFNMAQLRTLLSQGQILRPLQMLRGLCCYVDSDVVLELVSEMLHFQ